MGVGNVRRLLVVVGVVAMLFAYVFPSMVPVLPPK